MTLTWNPDGSATVQSDSGKTYRVARAVIEGQPNTRGWTCNCIAGQYGRACKHVKAVIEAKQRL